MYIHSCPFNFFHSCSYQSLIHMFIIHIYHLPRKQNGFKDSRSSTLPCTTLTFLLSLILLLYSRTLRQHISILHPTPDSGFNSLYPSSLNQHLSLLYSPTLVLFFFASTSTSQGRTGALAAVGCIIGAPKICVHPPGRHCSPP